MKYIILVFSLLLGSHILFAQSVENYSFQDIIADELSYITSDSKVKIHLKHEIEGPCNRGSVELIDNYGESDEFRNNYGTSYTIKAQFDYTGEYWQNLALVQTSDDVIPAYVSLVNGTWAFPSPPIKLEELETFSDFALMKKTHLYSDTYILEIPSKELYVYSTDGNLLSKLSVGFEIQSIEGGNELIYLFGNDRIATMNRDSIITNDVTINSSIQKYSLQNDVLYLAGTDSVYTFNENLEVLDARHIEGLDDITDIYVQGDKLYILENSDDISRVVSYNSSDLKTIEYESQNTQQVYHTIEPGFNDTLFLLGEQILKVYPTSTYEMMHSLRHAFNKTKASAKNVDISLSKVSIEDSTRYDTLINGEVRKDPLFFFNFNISVTNNSPTTVDNVILFSEIDFYFNCGASIFHKEYPHLNIVPGETKIISDRFKHWKNYDELCLQLHSVDGQVDINSSFNNTCLESTTSTDFTAIPRPHIYPIPSYDILNIEYPTAISKVYIYDNLGKNVLTHKEHSEFQKLDISELSQGVYYMRIETSSGEIISEKFIKQN